MRYSVEVSVRNAIGFFVDAIGGTMAVGLLAVLGIVATVGDARYKWSRVGQAQARANEAWDRLAEASAQRDGSAEATARYEAAVRSYTEAAAELEAIHRQEVAVRR